MVSTALDMVAVLAGRLRERNVCAAYRYLCVSRRQVPAWALGRYVCLRSHEIPVVLCVVHGYSFRLAILRCVGCRAPSLRPSGEPGATGTTGAVDPATSASFPVQRAEHHFIADPSRSRHGRQTAYAPVDL